MARMTTLKIRCGQCGHTFPINTFQPVEKIICPYCDEEMEQNMIEKVLKVWGTIADLNQDFRKYNAERDEKLFSINVEEIETRLPFEDSE